MVRTTYELGAREPLQVVDLPTPEEAFNVPTSAARRWCSSSSVRA
jgi:hypothetical protein